jgi:hypothetical protein
VVTGTQELGNLIVFTTTTQISIGDTTIALSGDTAMR